MARFNNPIIACMVLAAFIWLCVIASRHHEDVGYSARDRHAMASLISNLTKDRGSVIGKSNLTKAIPPLSQNQREQLANLFNTSAQ